MSNEIEVARIASRSQIRSSIIGTAGNLIGGIMIASLTGYFLLRSIEMQRKNDAREQSGEIMRGRHSEATQKTIVPVSSDSTHKSEKRKLVKSVYVYIVNSLTGEALPFAEYNIENTSGNADKNGVIQLSSKQFSTHSTNDMFLMEVRKTGYKTTKCNIGFIENETIKLAPL